MPRHTYYNKIKNRQKLPSFVAKIPHFFVGELEFGKGCAPKKSKIQKSKVKGLKN